MAFRMDYIRCQGRFDLTFVSFWGFIMLFFCVDVDLIEMKRKTEEHKSW